MVVAKKDAKKVNLHPGQMIRYELRLKGMAHRDLAEKLEMPPPHLSGLINGRRHVSAMLAIKLEKHLRIDALVWMEFQMLYDLDQARKAMRNEKGMGRARKANRLGIRQ